MNEEIALYWVQESMRLALLMTAPMLGAALITGLLVSIFQAVTSVQEMTLSYIPKILVIASILMVLAPWMIEMITDYITHVFQFIPTIAH